MIVKTIKFKLLIFVFCVSLIPILILTGIFYFISRSQLEQQIYRGMTAVASSKKLHLDTFFASKRGRVLDFGSDGFIRDKLEEIRKDSSASAILNEHLSGNKMPLDPEIMAIIVLDIDGKAVSSTNEVYIGKGFSDRDEFKQLLSNHADQTCIGQPHYCRDLGKSIMYISALITSRINNEAIGVIICAYDTDALSRIAGDYSGMGRTGEVVLGKREGDNIVFLNSLRYKPDAALNLTIPITARTVEPMRLALEGKEGTIVASDYRDTTVIGVYKYIPSLEWGMVTKMDKSEAFAPIRMVSLIALVIGIVCVVAVSGIGILFATTTAGPIIRLRYATEKFGQGNYDYRVNVRRDDEIGALSNGFNEMARRLSDELSQRKQREDLANKEVENKKRELEINAGYDQTYGDVMAIFSSSYNQEEILRDVLSLLAHKHSFQASAVYLYDEWNGTLNSVASHGIPDVVKNEYALGEGLVGQAAQEGKEIIAEYMDEKMPLTIETGVVSIKPAAIVVSPIVYKEKVQCVLVLASTEKLTERARLFIDRLSSQLGVALNNLNQYSSLKELSEQLKARGEEISLTNKQLERANRMKSEFLANMSHELRTPLNAIIGFSEILKDGIVGDLSSEQTDYVSNIFTSGQHLLSLINDILDLSKIEAGRMTLELESVSVPDILKNGVSMVKENAIQRNLKLELKIDDDVGVVDLDARKFRQIVYNLLSNAVKFTPDGGCVSINTKKIRIDAAEFLEITVADTGIGIAEEDMEKIFSPFEQIDSSLSRKYEGTGLGLAMVKRLVELYGGTICVTSEVDKGSRFEVRLPCKVPDEDAETLHGNRYDIVKKNEFNTTDLIHEVKRTISVSGVKKETGNSGEIRQRTEAGIREKAGDTRGMVREPCEQKDRPLILVVEDSTGDVELLRLYLEDAGYRVMLATNGHEALDLMSQGLPDLITLDLKMPEMDGLTFLREKAQRPECADIPVIIVSGNADGKKGLSLDTNAFLEKPIRRRELLDVVSSLVLKSDENKRHTVLLIDDDPKAIKIMSTYFNKERYDVLRTYGGREGVEAAITNIPDLIIVDLMMPEMDGFEVIHLLRKNEVSRKIPIVVLTAKNLTMREREDLARNVNVISQKAEFSRKGFLMQVDNLLKTQKKVKRVRKADRVIFKNEVMKSMAINRNVR